MVDAILGVDYKIKKKERDYLHGLMVGNIKECIVMMKRKDTEYLIGLMEESMKENGKMESKTEMEFIQVVKVLKERDFGRMVKELDGLKKLKIIDIYKKKIIEILVSCLFLNRQHLMLKYLIPYLKLKKILFI